MHKVVPRGTHQPQQGWISVGHLTKTGDDDSSATCPGELGQVTQEAVGDQTTGLEVAQNHQDGVVEREGAEVPVH